jgi:outer membrane assembly lipoprotein YfiO
MNLRTLLSISLTLLLISSASARKTGEKKLFDCDGKLKQAILDYQAKKYGKVKTVLDNAKVQCSGSPNMDTILYYLGMSYYNMKMYVEARSALDRLSSDFPDSPFYHDASFRSAMTVFKQSNTSNRDQKDTYEAIRLFNDYLDVNQHGPIADSVRLYLGKAKEKLEEKEYKNAFFYQRMKEYESAIVCYRSFISQYPESKFTEQAQLNIAESFIKLEQQAQAFEMVDQIVATAKNKEIIAKAKALKDPIKKK